MTTPERRDSDKDRPHITVVPGPLDPPADSSPFRRHDRYRVVHRDRGVERIDTGRYCGDGLAQWEHDDEWRVFAHIFERADGQVWTARPDDITGILPLDDAEPPTNDS